MKNINKFVITVLSDYSNFENNLYKIIPLLPVSSVSLKMIKSIKEIETVVKDNLTNLIIVNKANYTNEEVLYLSNIDYKDISEIIITDSYFKHESLFKNFDKGYITVRKPLSLNKFLEILKISVHGSLKKSKNGNDYIKIRAIEMAKSFLIQYENMFEEDAHKYLEKLAMDSRTTIYDESIKIISKYLFEKENIKYEHKNK